MFGIGTRVAHCAFEITLLQAIMLTLLLVCSFSSTQVQKYLAWVLYCGVPSGRFSRRFAPQNDIKLMQRSLLLNKAMLRQILILRRFVRYFFVQGKLHKKMS